MGAKVYHRRIGCVRAYIAIQHGVLWEFVHGRGWRKIGATKLIEAQDGAVKYQDRRYVRLPNHEEHLPSLPTT